MTQDEFIIHVYCMIEDEVHFLRVRRSGFSPKLSDAEALTLAVVGEFLGMHEDKAIWRYFKTHYRDWVAGRRSYVNARIFWA